MGGHSKLVLVLSGAGKPVYAWPAEPEGFVSLTAAISGLMAFAGSRGEELRTIRSGTATIVLLDRPPLALAAVSTLGEPAPVLRMQLSLLHAQVECVLTRSALSALFKKAPGYDLRRLLGGTDKMLDGLVSSWSSSPAALLGAYPSLPLPPSRRRALTAQLEASVRSTHAHYGMLCMGGSVVSLVAAAGRPDATQWEVLLLLNLVQVLGAGESLTPVCLPHADPTALLHAYVRRLEAPQVGDEGGEAPAGQPGSRDDAPAPLTLVLLVPGAPDRAGLAAAATALSAAGALATPAPALAVPDMPSSVGGGPAGTTPLLHFAYRVTGGVQFVVSQPLPPSQQQEVVLAYSQLRAGAYERGSEADGPLCGVRLEGRGNLTVAAVLGREGELLAAFDSMTGMEEAAALCGRLATWLRAQHVSWFAA